MSMLDPPAKILRPRLAKKAQGPFQGGQNTEATAISRICQEEVRCICRCLSRVQSSLWETCTFHVSFPLTPNEESKTDRVKTEGDGEISFCGAIEMAGIITIKFNLMKNGITDLDMKSPLFQPGPVEPHFGKQVVIIASTDSNQTSRPGQISHL